jgi:hypothetical protein
MSRCFRPIFGEVQPKDPASWLVKLAENRLLPQTPLLVKRGLVPEWLMEPARRLASEANSVQISEDLALQSLGAHVGRVLLLKGALLDRTIYVANGRRTRCDTDVLIDERDLPRAREALEARGFVPMFPFAGDDSLAEQAWIYPENGTGWALDLHWRLLMHPALANVLGFEELWARSAELPSLPGNVRGLAPGDALLHACMHYFGGGHRGGAVPLIWLLDVDLLWRELGSSSRLEVVTTAGGRGIASLLLGALDFAQRHFDTPIDDMDRQQLAAYGTGEWRAWLTLPFRSRLRDLAFELRSEAGWGARLRRLRSLAFPSVGYMRWRYPDGSWLGLPGLYFQRVVGALGRLSRGR